MKILFLCNNKISWQLFNFLKDVKKENIEIYSDKLILTTISTINPDVVISYNYKYILTESVLTALDGKAINLHISFLPWNRGAHPNLWSFIEDTPKGVTIHLIDKGLDTGRILLQEEVHIDENNETLESSYLLLHNTIQNLFRKNWDKLKEFQVIPRAQPLGGSLHYVKDFERLQRLLGKIEWRMPIYKFKEEVNKIKPELYETQR